MDVKNLFIVMSMMYNEYLFNQNPAQTVTRLLC